MTQARDALAPIEAAVDAVDPDALDKALWLIAGARDKRIMGYGCGREGLQVQGFIMRLHHLGFHACMQGDMAAPALGPGHVFVACAGPGELSTVRALMGEAGKAGADTLLITAVPDAPLAALASQTLIIPATTMATDQAQPSLLPMGSVFEGALFVLFELMVLQLRDRTGETADTMRARHTNME